MHAYIQRIFVGAGALALALASGSGAAVADEGTATSYDGGFVLKHKTDDGESFKLKTQVRVQTRYTFETVDVGADERDVDSNIKVNRGRVTLSGHGFSEDFGFKFQADFATAKVAALKDYYIDYRVGGDVLVRLGQHKRPFSRQQIASSSRLGFVDRAITDRAFGAGRDLGFTVHNNFEKSPELEWAAGFYNGNGDGIVPDTFSTAVAARVGYNMGGIKGYSETDLEGGPPRLGVGASVVSIFDADGGEEDGDGDPTTGKDNGAVRAELDFIAKFEGVSVSGGVYLSTAQSGSAFADQEQDAFGTHIQAGYVLGGTHYVGIRYALVDAEVDANDQQELGLAYTLFKFGHNIKWQNDVALLTSGDQDFGDDIRARSQVEFSF
ncbi:MAG: hypothetical protein Tsb0020_13610 [Haliangiales bacterium]